MISLSPTQPSAQPLESPRREEVWPGLCVSPASVGGADCPHAKEIRAQDPGVSSVFMSGWGALLDASVLCVTLPSRGPVLSVPREPQPKLQGNGGEGG